MSMIFSPVSRGLSIATLLAMSAAWAGAADSTEPRSSSSKAIPPSATRPSPSTTKAGARGPLPDPSLLDGSSQPAEKKSEHGMIGEFELPGDENARSGKVGGPQTPGGQQGQQGLSVQVPGMPIPLGLPGGSAGLGTQQSGMPSIQLPNGQSAPGGQQAGGAQNPNAAGNPIQGAGGDPNGQAQGIQVAELGGEASGQSGAAGGDGGEKPKQMAIGDKAMRIDPSAAAQGGVIGAQQQIAGQTQQHEKGTGTGGKGSGGSSSGNRSEKGRAMPAGL